MGNTPNILVFDLTSKIVSTAMIYSISKYFLLISHIVIANHVNYLFILI